MTAQDARALLLKIAPRIEDHADEIARLCGYLPLALRVAASTITVRKDLSTGEYVRRLSDEKQRLNHLKEVDAALSVSYELLDEAEQRLWRALAVFPNTFDHVGAAAVWEMEADLAKDVLGSLMTCSLLEYDQGVGRYSLHDLARLFTEERQRPPESVELKRRHAFHYQHLIARASALYLEGGEALKQGLALFDLERENIEAGWAWAESLIAEDEQAAQLCLDYAGAGRYVLTLRQHPRDQIKRAEGQLTAARRLKNRQHEGAALGNLGIAYAMLGETIKAIEFHNEYLTFAREMGDRRAEGGALGNLGLAYKALGEAREAIEFHEQALVIHRELGYRQGEGSQLGNLGVAYAMLGESRRAIEFYETSLVIHRELGDLYGEANDLGNLGVAYSDLGKTRKAADFFEQCHNIHREIGDRRGEGNDLGNLGNAYAALGEQRKAIEFYEQQLTITREIGDRRGEGNSLWSISLVLSNIGEHENAIARAEEALRIFEEIESPHAEMVRSRLPQLRQS